MHLPNSNKMSEAEATSSELISDTVPAIDTSFCMANFTENSAKQ